VKPLKLMGFIHWCHTVVTDSIHHVEFTLENK